MRGEIILKLLSSLFLLFQLLVPTVLAQQSASIHTPLYTRNKTAIRRQNLCDRVHLYEGSKLELRYALEDLQLSVAVNQNQYFFYEQDQIRSDYPGLAAVLLDELADRGRFQWRNSFAVYEGPGTNHSWTEMLVFTTNYFDLSVDWWIHSLSRVQLGVTFPEGWYDASYILVAAKQNQPQEFNMWGWVLPFQGEVWLLIIFTLIYSGMVYMFLEYLAFPSQYTGRKARESFGNDIFYSFLLFTQHFQFQPKTPASRILATSMAMWALLLSSAYTANLASFFVVENTSQLKASTIEDAIRLGHPICIWGATAHATYVKQTYAKATLISVTEEPELYHSVIRGDCALAVTTVASFREFEADRQTNLDCQLSWVGEILKPSMAGFALKADHGRLCSSILYDVLNLHMLEMKADGFVEDAWEQHLARNQNHFCDSHPQDDQNNGRRSIYDMGGTFVFHFAVSILAIGLAVVNKLWKVCKKRKVVQRAISGLHKEEVRVGDNGELLPEQRADSNRDAMTTLMQDFWKDTSSMRLRHGISARSVRPSGISSGNGGGLDNVQLMEYLQDHMQNQQEHLVEEFRRQQDQLEQRIQSQMGAMMDLLKQQQQQQQGNKKEKVRKSGTRRPNLKPSKREASPQSSTNSTSTTTISDEARQQLRPRTNQSDGLLYPHEERQLQKTFTEYLLKSQS